MRNFVIVGLVALSAGCIDLNLPPRPGPPGPGSLSGRAVMIPPGRATTVPVSNARVELLGTGLSTVTDSTGFFRIGGIVEASTRVLFRADLDADGRPDRQKLLTLDAARVGLGVNSVLGDVTLVENATVLGQVLLSDVTTNTGHAGTLIFVPEGPYTATTSDDGRFVFSDLPEGTVSVAFFRQGYRTRAFDAVTLSSGQELTLATVRLQRDTASPAPVAITGRVRLPDSSPAADTAVTLTNGTERRDVMTGPDGRYEATGLTAGVFSIAATKTGYVAARVSNVAALSGRVELFDLVLNDVPVSTGAGGGGGFNTDVGGGSASVGGGSASVGGGSASVGGGSASVGGGSASVGGGSASVGGGSASVGGGSASVGGGSASVGGGSASVGGGSASVGGGSASVGGGSASVGGGSASVGGGSASVGGGSAVGGGSTTTAPNAPTGFTAIASDRQVTLSFSPSTGATSHRIYWSNQATVSKTTGTLLGTVTSPTLHQGLTNGATYFYVVTAVNTVGESAESAVASATPSAAAAAMNPRVLVRRPNIGQPAIRVGSRITARFDRDLNGATATPANVTLTLPDGGVVPVSVSAAGPIVTITPNSPLAFETTYRVTLGTGLQDSMNRPMPAADTWAFATASPAPSVTGYVGDSAITLTWNEVPGALYSIVRRTRGTTNDVLGTVTGTTFTDTTSTNGVSYAYSVSVVTPFGESAPSPDVVVVAQPSRPTPPTSINIVPGRTTALVNWQPASGATGYSVYRAYRSGGPFTRIASAFQSTTFFDTNLPPDSVVAYRVQTESLNGTSAWSVEAAERTDGVVLPAPSLGVTPGNSWARLEWAPVSGASHYLVRRVVWPSGAPVVIAMITEGTRFDDLSANNGITYRYFVGAVSQNALGDLAEVSASPIPGLVPIPPRLIVPDVDVNRVSISATTNLNAATIETFRSTSPDGGFASVAQYDTTAVGGTRYFYIARYRIGTEVSEYSPPVEAIPVPAVTPGVPDDVTIRPASGNAEVSFSAVPNATGYQVGTATTPGGTMTVRCATNDAYDNRCAPTLTDNQTVYVSVRALNGPTPGAWSPEQAVRPTNIGNTAGLATTSVRVFEGDRHLTVAWTQVPSAAEYRVLRSTRRSPWTLVTTTTEQWFHDSNVVNGTDYRYAVLPQNLQAPNTRYSPAAVSPYSQPVATAPPRVTGLTLAPTNNGILVRWNAFAGVNSYTVGAAFNAGGAPTSQQAYCGTSNAFATSCHLSVPNGTQYFVSVQATGPSFNGSSAWSNELSASPNPSAPAGPTSATHDVGNERIALRATRVANTTYRIWRRPTLRAEALVGEFPSAFFIDSQPNGIGAFYAMQAVTAQGVSPLVHLGEVTPSAYAPLAPQLLEATSGQGRYSMLWAPWPGVRTYETQVGTTVDGPFTYTTAPSGETNSMSVINGVTNGTEVAVVVRSNTAMGNGAVSAPLTVTPRATSLAQPQVTYVNGNQAVQLSWPTVTGAIGYQVMRRSASLPWTPLVSLTTRRHVDFDVENGETWIYAVRAMGSTEAGPWASESAAQAVDSIYAPAPVVTLRPANNGAFVEWVAQPGSTAYSVYSDTAADGQFNDNECNTNGEWETRCRATFTQPTYVIVRAANVNGYAVASLPVLVTPNPMLPAEPNIGIAPLTAGSVRVSWSAIASATGYHVYRRVQNGAPVEIGQTAMLQFTDMGLTTGQAYVYYVEAENAVGRSAWSNQAPVVAP